MTTMTTTEIEFTPVVIGTTSTAEMVDIIASLRDRQTNLPGRHKRCSLRGCHEVRFGSALCLDHYLAAERRMGRTGYGIWRAYVAHRDGWRCQLCGYRIDQRTAYPDEMSISLDHKTAQSARGSDHPDNLQAVHLNCNKQRGNTPLEELVPMPTFWERAQSWWDDWMAAWGEAGAKQYGYDIDYSDVRGEYQEGRVHRVKQPSDPTVVAL